MTWGHADYGGDSTAVHNDLTEKTLHTYTIENNDVPNNEPSGDILITGTTKAGQTLTVDTSDLSDADGPGSLSYQWLRDGSDINGATSLTYVLTQADVGNGVSVKVSYTDDGGTAESVTSSGTTSIQGSETSSSTSQSLLQVRGVETLTQVQASTAEHSADYVSGSTDKVMKFELWLDATELSTFDSAANQILDFSFDINWNNTELEALNWYITGCLLYTSDAADE